MKRVAVTGGIASGKSTAIAYIQQLGYPVFSCDEIYKKVIQQEEYVKLVGQEFPACIHGGKIDRRALSHIIFNNEEKRRKLNKIAHPLIMKELYRQMNESQGEIVFAEVPLLFEGGYENDFDEIIVVKRAHEDRVADLIKRNQISKGEAQQRIFSQFDYDSQEAEIRFEKCKAVVIQNDGDILSLEDKIKRAIVKLFS